MNMIKKLFQPKYMRYSAQEFAEDNGVLYVPVKKRDLRMPVQVEEQTNALLLAEGKYVMLHPPNDGMPTCLFAFYKETKKGGYIKVMDNGSAFKEITNLPEVLLQTAELYERHLDDLVFLDPMCFAVRLVDQISGRYRGRGGLAVMDDTLCNNNVPPKKQSDARRYFYNRFLDHFIGWNFGKAVSESAELRSSLARIIGRLQEMGLRVEAGPGFDVWCSKDVWHVEYAGDGTPQIIQY